MTAFERLLKQLETQNKDEGGWSGSSSASEKADAFRASKAFPPSSQMTDEDYDRLSYSREEDFPKDDEDDDFRTKAMGYPTFDRVATEWAEHDTNYDNRIMKQERSKIDLDDPQVRALVEQISRKAAQFSSQLNEMAMNVDQMAKEFEDYKKEVSKLTDAFIFDAKIEGGLDGESALKKLEELLKQYATKSE